MLVCGWHGRRRSDLRISSASIRSWRQGGANLSVGLMAVFLRQPWQSDNSNGTRQPCACSDKQHGCPSAAHGSQPGAYGHHLHITATNKKLADAVSQGRGTPAGGTPAVMPAGGGRSTKTPHPGNYCWTHGHRISKDHTSATCSNKATGHRDDATAANTLGGSEKDKSWDSART